MPLMVCSLAPTLLRPIGLRNNQQAHNGRLNSQRIHQSSLLRFTLSGSRQQPPFLRSSTIGSPGSREGLWAKFGRLFTRSSSGRSSSSPSTVTSMKQTSEGFHSSTAVSAELYGEVEERQGRGSRDSAGGGSMQTLYISHGSPMLCIEYDNPAREVFARLGSQGEKPKAVVIVSAHWDTTEPTVTSGKTLQAIYDFYGFPKECYEMTYDAPGDPQVAQRVVDLLQKGGFPKAKKDERRGLDHGAWIPLLIMYPERDVPIVELSLQCRKDAAHHYKIGKALEPLKNEGVLVIGSGSATHNLGNLRFDHDGPPVAWAADFDNWLHDALCDNRYEDMINYREKAPYARKAHPTAEHILPAIVALGAAGQDAVGEQIHSDWAVGTLSMASYSLKSPPSVAASA